eukprot:8668261-Ditylum_brightwellii.AAC.1
MEREATERACKEHEIQRKHRHQDFMMMMIVVVVTGVKTPATVSSLASSFESPSKLNDSPTHSTPTITTTTISAVSVDSHFQYAKEKEQCEFDEMGKNAEKTVLHDTVEGMHTPPLPQMQQHLKRKGRK